MGVLFCAMRNLPLYIILLLLPASVCAQEYNRNPVCGTDTISRDYEDLKNRRIQYRAFECTKPTDFGIRIEMGYERFFYNPKTQAWLGNHEGYMAGIAVAYHNFSFGAKAKVATVRPETELTFDGELLTAAAKLNPVKIDYDVSYDFNLRYNFTLAPYVAYTTSEFRVINQDSLGRHYDIPKRRGFTAGIALNKYFRIKDFEFFGLFVRWSYGFTNFEKVHPDLGRGYSNLTFGIAYKGFGKTHFYKRL